MTVSWYKGFIIGKKTLNQKNCFVVKTCLIMMINFISLTNFAKGIFLSVNRLRMELTRVDFLMELLQIVNWNSSSSLQEKQIFEKKKTFRQARQEQTKKQEGQRNYEKKQKRMKMSLAILQILIQNLLNFEGLLQGRLQQKLQRKIELVKNLF